ncbi:MAG: DUF1552 domain-containing protein [Deltaproteobacteria bacterium]|nr:DUF1552 domain-containing protein [Deltaproteobacteria bacterium]
MSQPPPVRTPLASRRLFLRSAAATIALPLLPSAFPREARADGEAPVRLVVWFAPNGIQTRSWTPVREGFGYDLPRLLAPLGDLSAQTNVVTGMRNRAAEDNVEGDHARGTGSFLSGVTVKLTSGEDIENGITFDQIAAVETQGSTPLPSLQLGMESGGNTGSCNAGYSCAYTRNLAWSGISTPLPNITDAAIAFERLFPGSDPSLSAAETARLTLLRTSVLDTVVDQANSLSARLGTDDRLKLDEYLTAMRDLEVRIGTLGTGGCGVAEPVLPGADLTALVQVMADLQVLALQCDATRIISFMLGNSGSNRSFDFLGVPGAHHEISHHQGDEAKIAQLETIAEWEVEQLAYFLGRLDETVDIDGNSILHNSMVYFSSEIEDGDDHNHTNLPILLAGAAGGRMVTGTHLVTEEDEELSNLYLAMLEAFGTPRASFGISDRVLPGLLT